MESRTSQKDLGRCPLIYDWRAPVSGLFYDFDRGARFLPNAGGVLEGEITSSGSTKSGRGK